MCNHNQGLLAMPFRSLSVCLDHLHRSFLFFSDSGRNMARGYSANRSSSSRATLKTKRKRSISIQKLRDSIDRSNSTTSSGKTEGAVADRPVRRVIRKVSTAPSSVQIEQVRAARSQSAAKQRSVNVTKAKSWEEPPNVWLAQKLAKEHMDDLEASEDEDETTRRQDVLTKYKAAGKLVDEVLAFVCDKCTPGANTFAICGAGDEELKRRVVGVFNKARGEDGRKVPRGIAYPCTVSVNNVLCNHSPAQESHAVTLKSGDVVKVHLGAHVDGYPVNAARTIIIPYPADVEVAAPATVCNTVEAARVALLAVIHMLRPGAQNGDITDYIHRVGHHYDVEAVEGVLSTRTKRWISDSLEAIITRRVTKEDPQQDVAPVTIKPFQVWNLDVAFTNAPSYKMGVPPDQVNIFRKNEFENVQDLRIPTATDFLREVNENFFCFPFHSLHAAYPAKARMGISILKKAGLVDELVALQCKPKFVTARFSCTVVVSDKRVNIVCGAPPESINYGAGAEVLQIPADVQALLNEPLIFSASDKTTEKKSKKKARTEAAPEAPVAPADNEEAQ